MAGRPRSRVHRDRCHPRWKGSRAPRLRDDGSRCPARAGLARTHRWRNRRRDQHGARFHQGDGPTRAAVGFRARRLSAVARLPRSRPARRLRRGPDPGRGACPRGGRPIEPDGDDRARERPAQPQTQDHGRTGLSCRQHVAQPHGRRATGAPIPAVVHANPDPRERSPGRGALVPRADHDLRTREQGGRGLPRPGRGDRRTGGGPCGADRGDCQGDGPRRGARAFRLVALRRHEDPWPHLGADALVGAPAGCPCDRGVRALVATRCRRLQHGRGGLLGSGGRPRQRSQSHAVLSDLPGSPAAVPVRARRRVLADRRQCPERSHRVGRSPAS